MNFISLFLVTLLVSYAATIPPGPLSVFVVHTTLQKNIRAAFGVAVGGVCCEASYAFLATFGLQMLNQYPSITISLRWALVGLLILIGIITFFQKNDTTQNEVVSANGRVVLFLKGVSLSLFNPQLIAFWVVVLVGYNDYDWLKITTGYEKIAFVGGAGLGTFLLVMTYAFIADKKREVVFKYLNHALLNKVIACLFWGLALLQLWSLVIS